MRVVKLPHRVLIMLIACEGKSLEIPVKVDWPEVQLTEEQVIANVFARESGQPVPYQDNSVFIVEIPRL